MSMYVGRPRRAKNLLCIPSVEVASDTIVMQTCHIPLHIVGDSCVHLSWYLTQTPPYGTCQCKGCFFASLFQGQYAVLGC